MTAARVIAVVQARLGSTRLPGKALSPIAGRPMLEHVLARAAVVPGIDRVVLATTTSPEDAALVDVAHAAGVASVRGSVEDVLDRYHAALTQHPADAIMRITADCPLLDPEVAGRVVAEYRRRAGDVDYVSNVHPPTFPDGLDTEVISASALVSAWREAAAGSDREHVTPYVWSRPQRFRLANVPSAQDFSSLRWTVDNARDLAFVREVYGRLAPEYGPRAPRFGMDAVLDLLRAHPEIAAINAGTRRNEGFERARRADLAAARGPGA